MCYCETCDEMACLECTMSRHVGPGHGAGVVYVATMAPVSPADADICGNDSCQHYRVDHAVDGSCKLCAARIRPSTAKDIAEGLLCPGFVDIAGWSDYEKFWKTFATAILLSSSSKVTVDAEQLVTADTFTLQLVCKSRWGWSADKTNRVISALIEDGAVKVIKRIFFDSGSSKSQQAVAKLSRKSIT